MHLVLDKNWTNGLCDNITVLHNNIGLHRVL